MLGKEGSVEERRVKVAKMYLEGRSQRHMAKKTGVSQMMIWKDLQVIRKLWKESAVTDYDERVALECQRLDAIEREAWKGWRRSMRDDVVIEESIGALGQPTRSIKKRGQAGSAHFLSVAMNCVKARCELLGLSDANVADSGKPVHVAIQLQQVIESNESYAEFRRQQILAGSVPVPGLPGDACERCPVEAGQTLDVAGLDPGESGNGESATSGAEVDSSDDWPEGSDQVDQEVDD